MNNTERVAFIDITKGIGILMVVLGHAYLLPYDLFKVFFSVHMPLFFLVSGYVFHFRPEDRFLPFLKKNAKGLLVPYLFTGIIIILLKAAMALVAGRDIWDQVRIWGIAALYGSGSRVPANMEEVISPIGVIWFLLALFIGKCILWFILHSRIPWLWALILFLASYVSAEYFWLPFSLQPGLCCVLFLYLGYEMKHQDVLNWGRIRFPIRILAAFAWVYCIMFCGNLCMVDNVYDRPLRNIIGAICGTVTIVFLAQLIERYLHILKRPLSFLGRNSLGIMCAHLLSLMCWPRNDIMSLLSQWTSWPEWVCDEIDILFATAFYTAVLFFIPWLHRYFFPAGFRYRKERKWNTQSS